MAFDLTKVEDRKKTLDVIVKTNQKIINAPVTVSVLGIFIFGGGYIYLKKYFSALIYMILLGSLYVLLLDITNVLPFNFTQQFSFLNHGYVTYGIAGCFIFLWWISIVYSAIISQPYYFYQNASKKTFWLLWLLPFAPYYVQGKYIRGHFTGLGFLIFIVIFLIFKISSLDQSENYSLYEARTHAIVLVVLCLSFSLILVSWIDNFSEFCQIYFYKGNEVPNHTKGFVLFFLLLIFLFCVLQSMNYIDSYRNLKTIFLDFLKLYLNV